MSTPRKIADNIRMDILGGQLTDQPPYQLLQIYEKMNQSRGDILGKLITDAKFRTTDYNALQPYYCVYDKAIQDNPTKYVRFAIPEIINIPKSMGLFWVGRTDRTQDFRVVSGIGEISSLTKIKAIKPSSLRVDVIYNQGYLYVYGDLNLKGCLVEAYFRDPFVIPVYSSANTIIRTFDEDLDEYPMSESYLHLLYDEVRSQIQPPMVVDNKTDGTITAKINTNDGRR